MGVPLSQAENPGIPARTVIFRNKTPPIGSVLYHKDGGLISEQHGTLLLSLEVMSYNPPLEAVPVFREQDYHLVQILYYNHFDLELGEMVTKVSVVKVGA
eukprot:706051-Rhodomonas_salina.1